MSKTSAGLQKPLSLTSKLTSDNAVEGPINGVLHFITCLVLVRQHTSWHSFMAAKTFPSTICKSEIAPDLQVMLLVQTHQAYFTQSKTMQVLKVDHGDSPEICTI